MKFHYNDFSCDVSVYWDNADLVVKFYDQAKEHREEQIVNLVIVDPGYGYISLKFIGQEALLSGYLEENIFSTDAIVNHAIEFVENLSPRSAEACIPHRVFRVKLTSCVEYNGEY